MTDVVAERTLGILIETVAFLGAQLAHRDHLRRRREALSAEGGAAREAALAAHRRLLALAVEPVEWGDLVATAPLGRPREKEGIEAHYVRVFLEEHADLAHQRVLEIAGAGDVGAPFGPRFGFRSDLVPVACLPELVARSALPRERYDCAILAHALGHDADPRATLRHVLGLLAPGGVLLCTVSTGTSVAAAGDAWGATEPALRGLLAEQLPDDAFELRTFGNALACVAAAHDLAAEDLSERERAALDPEFPLVVCARARKPGESGARAARAAGHRVPRGGAGAVLAYHRIAQVHPDFSGLCVPTPLFRAQMEHLAERCRVLPLPALLEAAEAADLPERSVAVTFDDGTLDALEVAAPILEGLGLPATFFVMADAIDGPAECWETELAHLLLEGDPCVATLDFEWGSASRSLPFGTPAERYDACWRLLSEGYSRDGAARQALLEALARHLGGERSARPSHRRMGAEEIRELARRPGCAVGAHGVHHLALPRHSVAVQHAEIADSRARLEALLGRPVALFAYPYGEHRIDAAWLVEAAGFRGAVTVEPGVVRSGVDPFRTPRHEAPALARERFGEWLEARLRA